MTMNNVTKFVQISTPPAVESASDPDLPARLAAAEARLAELKAVLRTVLLAGERTADVRSDIVLVKAEVKDTRNLIAIAKDAEMEEAQAALDAVSDALQQSVIDRFSAEFLGPDNELPEGNTLMKSFLDKHAPALSAATDDVAAAEHNVANAEKTLQKIRDGSAASVRAGARAGARERQRVRGGADAGAGGRGGAQHATGRERSAGVGARESRARGRRGRGRPDGQRACRAVP
jgi:multidrug efflux pump subunit AcrA (membrane-fusion protein)